GSSSLGRSSTFARTYDHAVRLAHLPGLLDSGLRDRLAVAQHCYCAGHEPARNRSFGCLGILGSSARHLSPRASRPIAFSVFPIAASTFTATKARFHRLRSNVMKRFAVLPVLLLFSSSAHAQDATSVAIKRDVSDRKSVV